MQCAVFAFLAMVSLCHCYPVGELLAQDSTQQQQIILIPANILKQAQQDLVASASENQEDLKPSESGHHHGHHENHGNHGHDASGYLDMGAYSGKHGAFGWYADFPVGHH